MLEGLGCHLAQWLIACGEHIVDVASTATARVRAVNQLHAVLRDLIPGGAKTKLSAAQAAEVLRRVRPASPPEATRKNVAWDLVRQIRHIDECLARVEADMATALAANESTLTEVDGVGPVLGVRILGRTRDVTRFASADAFAAYAGAAPVEASSGERVVHRLSRSGDRRLNAAIHLVAVTQVRMRTSQGRGHYAWYTGPNRCGGCYTDGDAGDCGFVFSDGQRCLGWPTAVLRPLAPR